MCESSGVCVPYYFYRDSLRSIIKNIVNRGELAGNCKHDLYNLIDKRMLDFTKSVNVRNLTYFYQ